MSAGIACVDVLGAHVEVRDGAEHVRRGREREQHALGPEAREQIAGVDAGRVRVHLDEVRLDPVGVDREPGLGERLAEPPRVRVVVGEPLDVVVEPVDPGRGDDARPGASRRRTCA